MTSRAHIEKLDILPALTGKYLTLVELNIFSTASIDILRSTNLLWKEKLKKLFPEEYKQITSNINWRQEFNRLCREKFQHYPARERSLYFHAFTGNITGLAGITIDDLQFSPTRLPRKSELLKYAEKQQIVLDYIYQLINQWYPDASPSALLHWAIDCNQPIDLIDNLIGNGASIHAARNMLDAPGRAILHGNLVLVRHLYEVYHANLHYVPGNKFPPIIIAIWANQEKIIKYMLENHMDIHQEFYVPTLPFYAPIRNALDFAICYGSPEIIQLLSKYNANLSDLNNFLENNQLHLAAFGNNFATLKYFLEANPDNVNILNGSNKTPLQELLENNSHEKSNINQCFQLLCSHGAELLLTTNERIIINIGEIIDTNALSL